MFRKWWNTIKFFGILAVIILVLPRSILPHKSSETMHRDMDEYIRLNDSETRLIEYKDDNEALSLKLAQVDVINASRKKYRAQPVKLDILASRVANRMSREAAAKEFVGHWNTAGEKPYHRYGFAGGYDHIAENAYGEWTNGNYEASASLISSMMKKGHATFMAEKAPYDGHKKTVIDKYHNYVGIGYALTGNQFRYYEEFIDRYLEYKNIPSEVSINEQFIISVKPVNNEYPYFMVVYRDKPLKPMTPAQIKRQGSYDDFSDEQYSRMTAWDLSEKKSGDYYDIPLTFTKEGIYYIHIFLDRKEYTSPASLDTRGKTPASGIVIKAGE